MDAREPVYFDLDTVALLRDTLVVKIIRLSPAVMPVLCDVLC